MIFRNNFKEVNVISLFFFEQKQNLIVLNPGFNKLITAVWITRLVNLRTC